MNLYESIKDNHRNIEKRHLSKKLGKSGKYEDLDKKSKDKIKESDDIDTIVSSLYNAVTDMDTEADVDMEEEPDYIQDNYEEYIDDKLESRYANLDDKTKKEIKDKVGRKLHKAGYIYNTKYESCKGKRGKKKLKENELPEFCYSVLPSDETKVIAVKRNEEGYFPVDIDFPTKEDAKAFIDKENKVLGVDEATRNAMEMGSMFGWHVPGANPDTWRKEKPANKLGESANAKKRFKKKLKESEIPSGPLGDVLKVIEDYGWGIDKSDSHYTLENYSPAGEDYIIEIDCDDNLPDEEKAQKLIDAIYREFDNFDVDEHVDMWVEARGSGVGGVPSTRALVKDAEDIEKMLRDLYRGVSKVTRKVNESCKGKRRKRNLKETNWVGTIKSGGRLRSKLHELDEDASPEQCREVLDILKTCCEEGKTRTDDEYYQDSFQSIIDDIECIYVDEELNSSNVDYELDDFYDVCDGAGLFVKLDESCKGRKSKKKLKESVYALEPEYGGRNSYYGKALVEVNNDGRTLYSYGTPIARIKDGNFELLCDEWALTNTTLRHLREFMQQEGLQPIVRKDLVKMINGRDNGRMTESAKGSIVAKRLKESAGSLELPKEVTDELESDQHNIYQASVNEMALSSYGSYDEIEEFFKGAPACQAFARECNEKGIPFEECRKALHDKAQQVVVWAGTNIADGQDDEYINSISQNK